MNSVQKFLFETSFDGDAGAAAADAPSQAGPAAYGERDLELARDEGFAAGREQGLKEAATSIDNAAARALEAVAEQLQTLGPALRQDATRRDGEALRAAVTIVRKLFPQTVKVHGKSEVEGLIAQCLAQLRDEQRMVIRVADELLDPLHERLGDLSADCGFEGKIVLLAEEAFLPGDARVEWADGGAERDSARLWREVDEIVARATTFGTATAAAARDREPAAAGPEPDPAPAGPQEIHDHTTAMTPPA